MTVNTKFTVIITNVVGISNSVYNLYHLIKTQVIIMYESTYLSSIDPYRFVADSSQMTSNGRINLGSLELIPMSNQLKHINFELHAISRLLCWINER